MWAVIHLNPSQCSTLAPQDWAVRAAGAGGAAARHQRARAAGQARDEHGGGRLCQRWVGGLGGGWGGGSGSAAPPPTLCSYGRVLLSVGSEGCLRIRWAVQGRLIARPYTDGPGALTAGVLRNATRLIESHQLPAPPAPGKDADPRHARPVSPCVSLCWLGSSVSRPAVLACVCPSSGHSHGQQQQLKSRACRTVLAAGSLPTRWASPPRTPPGWWPAGCGSWARGRRWPCSSGTTREH